MSTQEGWRESFIVPNVQKIAEKGKESGKRARKGPLALLDLQAHLVHKVHLEFRASRGSQAITQWVHLAHLALLDPQGHLDHKVHLDHRDLQVAPIKPSTERPSQLWCIFKVRKPLSK